MNTFEYNFEKTKLEFSISENKIYFTNCGFFQPEINSENLKNNHLSEVQISGNNHLEHHFNKHFCSSENYSLNYDNISEIKNINGSVLKILQKNDNIEVTTYFEFFKDIDGYRTYKEINSLKDEINLNYVSAFCYTGLGGNEWEKNINIYLPHNYWKAECSWRKYTCGELGLYNCSDFSAKRINICNTGTWTSVEYLPMGMVENTKKNKLMFWQIEGVASWAYEISSIANDLYLSISGPSLQESSWQKKLLKNQTYKTPAVFICFGNDIEDVFKNTTIYRRRNQLFNIKDFGTPAIFNDYMHCLDTNPSMKKELPFINIASEIGCKYYMIDAGWYSDGFWWDNTGEWLVSKDRFPKGLEVIFEYIKNKGMKPGLWVEIEVMSVGLEFANSLPDNWFLSLNGKRIQDNSRYILDFSIYEVQLFASKIMNRLINEYGAMFIKMDYNVNAGIGTDKRGNIGEGLESHINSYFKWVKKMIASYPNILFENCASGGCRIDAELLKSFHLQSSSDQTDYKKYSAISSNITTAVTPEQCGVWTYPKKDSDEEETAYNMVNAILLRIYQSGRLDEVNQNCFNLVKEAISINNDLKLVIQSGYPVFPIGLAKFDDDILCFGLKKDNEIYLCIWNRDNINPFELLLAKYKPKQIEIIYPKSLTTTYSFNIESYIIKFIPHQKYFARLIKLIL